MPSDDDCVPDEDELPFPDVDGDVARAKIPAERTIYRDDHVTIVDHIHEDPSDERVAVWVGDERPTIVDARDLNDALGGYLDGGDDGQD